MKKMILIIGILVLGLVMFGCNEIHYALQGINAYGVPSEIVYDFNKELWVNCDYFNMKDYATEHCEEYDCKDKFASVFPFCADNKKTEIESYEVLSQDIGDINATVSARICLKSEAFPDIACMSDTYFLNKIKNRWLVDRITRYNESHLPEPEGQRLEQLYNEKDVNVSVLDAVGIFLQNTTYVVEVVDARPGFELEQDILFLDIYKLDNLGNEILMEDDAILEKCLVDKINCSVSDEILQLSDDCVLTYRSGCPSPGNKATITVKCDEEIQNISVYKRYLTFGENNIPLIWASVNETKFLLLTKNNESHMLSITYKTSNRINIKINNKETAVLHFNETTKMFDDIYMRYSEHYQIDEKNETDFTIYGPYSIEELGD